MARTKFPKIDELPLPKRAPNSSKSIEDRRTPELVFGFAGPVASGVSIAARLFLHNLQTTYDYTFTEHIHVSETIDKEAASVGKVTSQGLSGFARISHLQDVGNALRERYGADYLAKKAIERIERHRDEFGYNDEKASDRTERVALAMRWVYIIDSIKNPAEVELLREVYGDMFWLVGVFAPQVVAEARLRADHLSKAEIHKIMERDEAEEQYYGQNVRKVFADADFFINNDKDVDTQLSATVSRYLNIIFGTSVQTLNTHEAAMHQAASAASRSACMSRKVGASIVNEKGDIIALGWNDAPKCGGGLYTEDDKNANGDNDNRCYHWKRKECHNDSNKTELIEEIVKQIVDADIVKSGDAGKLRTIIARSEIKSLIEFSRAVHAEMEAILSIARSNKEGLVGSSLYTTCYPCHNCARHIVAAGIKRVYFIEPYPKSRALQLHSDSITSLSNQSNKTIFSQYEGVAPKNILRLFGEKPDRKKGGKAVEVNTKTARPLFQPHLDSFTLYEQRILKEIHDFERRIPAVQNIGKAE